MVDLMKVWRVLHSSRKRGEIGRKKSPCREGGVMSVQVGQKAPDFSLKTSKMQDFKLSDLQGKKNVVLLFVPLAFTGG